MKTPRKRRTAPSPPFTWVFAVGLGLGLLICALTPAPASAGPIATKSNSSGLLGELKGVGNWFQNQQTQLTSALGFGGSKSASSGNATDGQGLESAVAALTPAQVHRLALAAARQDPSLTPMDGLIPHTPRVVALEKQRGLNPTRFDAQYPSLGVILSRDEAMRAKASPLVTQAMVAIPPSAEVVAGTATSPTVVPEPGGVTIALTLIGAVALAVGRGRRG